MLKTALISLIVLAGSTSVSWAGNQIHIAGSSTVLPYASIVAEQFGKAFNFPTPIVESGGSSAGLKQFCQGADENTIDIANSSRPIKQTELQTCAKNGVIRVLEVRFGYDGIVFAISNTSKPWSLTPKDVYLALASKVPVDGKLVDNPYKTWKEVNANLPDWPIKAFIPGEKHGTREVFELKVMEVGCKEAGADKLTDEKGCIHIRKDGAAADIDGDYTETLARIEANKKAVGVFGLSFYENNTDKLIVATMSGVTPSVETISTGQYPVSRPLFFYVKLDHARMVPGLMEYVRFFASPNMLGPDGPLAEYGLVPLPKNELDQLQDTVDVK